jgi:hypothetical protein
MKTKTLSMDSNLDIGGFRIFLAQRKLNEKGIRASLERLRDFAAFLQEKGKSVDSLSRADFTEYSSHLIESGQNTDENYLALLRYGYLKHFDELYIAAMEVLDGSEVPANLSRRLAEEFGEDMRREIFSGIGDIPLGLPPGQKPLYMKKLIWRIQRKIGTEGCAQFLNKGLRDRYEESRKPDKERFARSNNIDDFLVQKHDAFIETIIKCHKEKRPFFTQEITPEVIDLVRKDPYIESGVRHGNKIIVKKIPHMAKEYLKETDAQKKKYFYCHCPWVKEALLAPEPFPAVFCNCSAGFYRAYWEIVLEQPVRVDVLESLLSGGNECRFAVHLPESALDKT